MSLVMRAALALQSGCRLRYDPPLVSDDYRSQQFFKEHRGKVIEFVGHGEKLVGVLDFQGREPGRYIEPDCINARFENESEVLRLNSRHCVVIEPSKATIVEELEELQRIGNLPFEVHFYPEDLVRFVKNRPERFADVPHEIGSIFMEEGYSQKNGLPGYEVFETLEEHRARRQADAVRSGDTVWLSPLGNRQGVNTGHEDLALVSRGNVYWLYHAPVEMHFESEANEAEFWSKTGISRPIGGDHTLTDSLRKFRNGEADILSAHGFGVAARYYPHRLLDRWAEHRPRVRALTERFYREYLSEVA